jgi:hypothetical protein
MQTFLEGVESDVRTVFDYWRVRMVHNRARLDEKRRRKIRGRLNDGYSVQDLRDAIDGCALSRFHMGDNDRKTVYNEIGLICRDAEHVDKFMKLKQEADAQRAKRAHLKAVS